MVWREREMFGINTDYNCEIPPRCIFGSQKEDVSWLSRVSGQPIVVSQEWSKACELVDLNLSCQHFPSFPSPVLAGLPPKSLIIQCRLHKSSAWAAPPLLSCASLYIAGLYKWQVQSYVHHLLNANYDLYLLSVITDTNILIVENWAHCSQPICLHQTEGLSNQICPQSSQNIDAWVDQSEEDWIFAYFWNHNSLFRITRNKITLTRCRLLEFICLVVAKWKEEETAAHCLLCDLKNPDDLLRLVARFQQETNKSTHRVRALVWLFWSGDFVQYWSDLDAASIFVPFWLICQATQLRFCPATPANSLLLQAAIMLLKFLHVSFYQWDEKSSL